MIVWRVSFIRLITWHIDVSHRSHCKHNNRRFRSHWNERAMNEKEKTAPLLKWIQLFPHTQYNWQRHIATLKAHSLIFRYSCSSQFELWFIFFKLIQSSFVSWTCADESHSSYRHFCAINFWKKSISPLKTRVDKTSKWVEVHWNRLTKFTITFDWAAFDYFMRKRVIGKVVSVQFVDRSSTRVSGEIEVPILMFPLFDWFVARWFIVVNF